jgi:uncharacterized protein YkwD
MSFQLRHSVLLTICVMSQSAVYGQRIQEIHTESAQAETDPIEAPNPALDLKRVRQLIFKKTNEFRTGEKRTLLKSNPELDKAAKDFAEYLAETDKFSHTADGQEPWDRTAKAGYEHAIVLENIAYEYNSEGFTAEELAKDCEHGWENSPGHRKNLLDADVQDIGIALARSSRTGRYYAVQDFGRPKSATITFKVSNRIETPVKYTVDGQKQTAGPLQTITHERSRPPELRFSWDEKVKVTPAAKMTFHPANGTSFTIRMTDDDEITIESK